MWDKYSEHDYLMLRDIGWKDYLRVWLEKDLFVPKETRIRSASRLPLQVDFE